MKTLRGLVLALSVSLVLFVASWAAAAVLMGLNTASVEGARAMNVTPETGVEAGVSRVAYAPALAVIMAVLGVIVAYGIYTRWR